MEIRFTRLHAPIDHTQLILRLGGTFVVDDDTVRFAHADKFPGDHPAIADVLRAAGISLVDAEGVAV